MLAISDAVLSAWLSPARQLRGRIKVKDTMYESEEFTSLSFDSGSISGETYQIGSTYMNTVKVVFPSILEEVAEDVEIVPEIAVLVDDEYHYTKLGHFYVTEFDRDRNTNTTTLTASDKMIYMEGIYTSKLTFPKSYREVALEVANLAGVEVDETSFATLQNLSIAKPEGYTHRQAIGLIAQFEGGFANFNREGKLEIRRLRPTEFGVTPESYLLKGFKKNENAYRIGGITVRIGDEESATLHVGSTNGSQVVLENKVMTQSLLNLMWNQVKDLIYFPFDLKWRGCPALEAGDWMYVTDRDGTRYSVPNLSYSLSFNGGMSAESKATTDSSSQVTYKYRGPLSQKVDYLDSVLSANKWNQNYYDATKPTNPKEGDIWFKPNGQDIEIWIYEKDAEGNLSWMLQVSTAPDPELVEAIEEVGKEVEQAQSDSATALENANDAVNKANEASAKADQSQQTAEQAKSDAANAVSNANQAKDDAQDALDKAGQADATANQAKTDATTAVNTANQAKSSAGTALDNANQAKDDAQDALDKAGQADATANQAKTDATTAVNTANQAKSSAGTALDNANQAIADATDALNQSALAKSQAEEVINKYLGMGMVPAWSWSPDGADRFTTVKPDNIFDRDDWLNRPDYDVGGIPAVEFLLKKSTEYTLATNIPKSAQGYADVFLVRTGSVPDTNANGVFEGSPRTITTASDGILSVAIRNHSLVNLGLWVTLTEGTIPITDVNNDYTNAIPSYIGFAIEPSDNPADYTWIRNPEKVEGEVKVELTEINGELSRKVSQETFDQLNGTVINHSTLISQNQNEIKLKADQSTVDTINQTVSDHSTAIDLNSKAIALKANQSTVDSLTGRVTTTEGSIDVLAGQVALKANKTDVDTIAGRVTSAESQLTVQAGKITGLSTLTDGHTTQIGSLQSGYDGLSSTVSKVESDLSGLSVGGRNYFSINAWEKLPPPEYSGYISQLQINLEPNTEYVMSTNIPNWADNTTCDLFVFNTNWEPSSTVNGVALNKPRKVTTLADGIVIVAMRNREFNTGTWWAMLSKGNKALDWIPAPEDMATTSEMSSLTQTVDSISATVMANKTEADGKFSSQQTAINANTNSIKLKANQSTVDTLTGRVSTAEGSIDVLSGQVALKANQSTVNTLTNTVNAHSSELTVQAGKISGLTSLTDGHTTKIGALELQAGQFSLSLSSVQNDLNGLEIGGRNYFSVNAWQNRPSFSVSDIPAMKIIVEPNTEYVMSTNIPNWADNTTCDLFVFNTNWEPSSTVNGVALNKPRKVTTLADGIVIVAMRNREFNTGTWWAMLSKGNKALDWIPAPEDMATVTALTEVKATVDSLTMTVADKADKTTVTQLANQWQQTTDLANGHTSQISSLGDAINLRVEKDDIINQININDQGVLIAGEKVHITGQTTIDSAVIKTAHIADAAITNAKIDSLSADKVTVGTLNGGNVNIINLNADNIVSGTISGQNLSINLTSGEVMFTKGSIRNADATFVMDIVTGVVSSRGTVLSPNSTGDLLPTGFDLMNGKLQFMNGSYGETSVVYGGIDTNTHYGQVLNSSSSWISGNYFSNAPTLVVNSGDQTNSVWQSWKKNVALGTTDFKELPMLSSGVKAGLGLTGSKNAYDQNIIGGSMGIVSNATSSVCPDGFAQTKAVIQARNGIYMSSGFHYQVSGSSVSILTPASIRIGDTTNDNGSADAQKQSAASIFAQGHTFTFKGDTADLWANHHKLRGLYSATKSASANIYLDTDGSLYRATSARKYKTAITIADDVIQHAKRVLSIQPSSWFDKSELGQPTLERRYGFIADEFHEAGLREVVVYNKNEIESLAYDRIPMYHNVILNEHEQRIKDLENEVQKLKMEIEGLKAA
ncbi:gp58-like family protein [Enterococcus asini]|uniref:gp58-like family protein n=1 Tax=Enterococcus asini TaxID=57732 RepID=UPI00241E95B5|nr:gp58-like family protein [Enterococcus asini]